MVSLCVGVGLGVGVVVFVGGWVYMRCHCPPHSVEAQTLVSDTAFLSEQQQQVHVCVWVVLLRRSLYSVGI